MTRTGTRFPIASRLLAIIATLVIVTTLAAGAGAVSKSDVESATAKVKKLLADVASAKTQLVGLQGQLAQKTAIVDQAEGKLEQLTSQLLITQHALDAAKATYRRTVARLNDRAAEAYMSGGGQNLEFLVGAGSLGELSDRIEYMNTIAQEDLDLATTVANTKNALTVRQRSWPGSSSSSRTSWLRRRLPARRCWTTSSSSPRSWHGSSRISPRPSATRRRWRSSISRR